jgi:transcription antitermination factor NusG
MREMDNANYNWYVFYTRPKSEKVVCQELERRQFSTFLPTVKSLRRWKNRQSKVISEVLFPGYVFVRAAEWEITGIEQVSGVVYCVRCGDRPALVQERDISCIERMLSTGQEVFVDDDFTAGESVKVTGGLLDGYEGVLLSKKGRFRFCVLLKDIGQCVSIDIHVSLLRKVR